MSVRLSAWTVVAPVPNRLTAVPSGPAPELGGVARRVRPAADAFMVAMISRPLSGSLATTWVTPATFWLSAGSAIGAAALTALLMVTWLTGGSSLVVLGVIACLAFAAGAASVVIVALDQRRRR